MSLFNRPAWAKTQAPTLEDAEENLFSHSSRSFNQIVAEEQRRKKERAEKQRLKQAGHERKDSGKREVKNEGGRREREHAGGSPKRRRITCEEGEGFLEGIGGAEGVGRDWELEKVDGEGDGLASGVRRSPRVNRTVDKESAQFAVLGMTSRPAVIELGDSDTEPEADTERAPQSEPEDDESDDELAELARQARARRKLKDAGLAQSQTPEPQPMAPRPETIRHPTPPPAPPALDPPVKLFITSDIPNTQPLIVYRKLSQRLQEIRQVWCSKQNFPDALAAQVFLVHRARKLYDVTTCKSLGLYVDAEGRVAMKGAEGLEGVDQVHLEAVTPELFAQLKARQRSKGLTGAVDGVVAEVAAAVAETQQAAPGAKDESLIRVLLKAKGVSEPFKLKVKPTTTFAKIMGACRAPFKVGESQALFLEFDGDRLLPEDLVQSTDISDMDCIDVHIT